MKTTLLLASFGIVSIALAPVCAHAQDFVQSIQHAVDDWRGDNNEGNWDKAQRATPDAKFLFQAARRTMTEIREAEMARRNSQDSAIRDGADELVQEDRRALEHLRGIAQRRGFDLPTRPDDDQRDELARLSDASGPHFDREFAHDEVHNHERTLELFRREADDGQDREIQDYARDVMPRLNEHLDHARQLEHRY